MVDALTGKRVRVVRGPHRGYMGTVQHANDTHVRMELDASNKVITIKREYVDADDGRGAGARRTARSMQTPMRAHMTPAYVPEFARAPPHRSATDVSSEDDCPRLECKECTRMASAVHVSCSAVMPTRPVRVTTCAQCVLFRRLAAHTWPLCLQLVSPVACHLVLSRCTPRPHSAC